MQICKRQIFNFLVYYTAQEKCCDKELKKFDSGSEADLWFGFSLLIDKILKTSSDTWKSMCSVSWGNQ